MVPQNETAGLGLDAVLLFLLQENAISTIARIITNFLETNGYDFKIDFI
jgi:hypothetical protein